MLSNLACITVFLIISYPETILGQYFSPREISTLFELQDRVCAFSLNNYDSKKFDPWFCVKSKECKVTSTRIPIETVMVCNDYQEIDNQTCCFMGNVRRGKDLYPAFIAEEKYWGLASMEQSFEEYANYLYKIQDERIRTYIEDQTVCGLFPNKVGIYMEYVPYICWHIDCTLALNNHFSIPMSWRQRNPTPTHYPEGDRFCRRESATTRYCCHPGVSVRSNGSSALGHLVWSFRELSLEQKYAVGFRSSFQCEQYSKLVCDEDKDRCSQRVLDKSTSVPGEFPHQALIGVQSPTLQFFHCGGALVSKLFILSAAECETYEGYTASIALLAEHDMYETNEFGERGVITFLSEVFIEPYDNTGPKVALFRMWRQAIMDYWIRPACIDWKSNFNSLNLGTKTPDYLKFTGFGTTTTGGRYNRTLKRLDVFTDPLHQLWIFHFQCSSEIAPKVPLFCSVKSDFPDRPTWAPCEFDLGGPVSTTEPEQAPYCQWKVFGVSAQRRDNCSDDKFAIFKDTTFLLAWMEDVIWKFDMHLSQFNMSWPKCHNKLENTFSDMIHLKPRYPSFFFP